MALNNCPNCGLDLTEKKHYWDLRYMDAEVISYCLTPVIPEEIEYLRQENGFNVD